MPAGATTLAWLSFVTAVDHDDEGAEDILGQCPVPLAVIDLVDCAVISSSPGFGDLVGGTSVPGAALTDLAESEDRVHALCSLLQEGVVDGFEGSRTLRAADGTRVRATSWVTVIDLVERRRAAWVLAPDDGEVVAPVTPPDRRRWPRSVPGAVVGVLDGSLQVVDISRTVEAAFGFRTEDVIGRPATFFVHPEDVHLLLTGIARALDRGAGVGTELRIRDQAEHWHRMQTMLVPLHGDDLRIGYSIVPAPSEAASVRPATSEGPAAATEGADDLERRLRRIAEELRLAGFGAAAPVAGPRAIPELAALSSRQWEILERLLRGERVPGIAQRLYLSQSTVRNHLAAIYRHLGVNSQEELLTVLNERMEPQIGT